MTALALWTAVLAAGPAPAEVLDLDPAARGAVERAAAYLRGRYGNNPQPPAAPDNLGGGHPLGTAALAGLALLESGALPADPVVQGIAGRVRAACLPDINTYQVALSVLFLDRLGDPADRGLIQVLGVKLYAGLSATGGYGYTCGEALPADAARLLSAPDTTLRTKPAAPQNGDRGPDGFVRPPALKDRKGEPPPTGLHPVAEQYFRRVQAQLRAGGRSGGDGDNSNTQFGLIGLWVAARNGLPADDAFALIEARFLRTQNANAGWSYSGGGQSTPSMTCAGLLGLAVGAGRHTPTPPDRRKTPPAGGGFVPAPKPKATDGPPLEGVRNKRAVTAALAALGTVLQAPAGGGLGQFVGLGNEYYLLWSIERVCMAYNLLTLGDQDWYTWGLSFLLPAQQADGSWPGVGNCSQDVDTCFAVLFLMKSNVVSDLSAKMGGPPERTLKAGGDAPPPMFAPRQDNPPKGADPAADPLVTASDADFPGKLAALRDATGGANTQALARAIPKLPADRQAKARDALAQRLTRMTANTLRGMLKGGDEEVKRAAASAAAGKADKGLVPDLIATLADPADAVAQAARQALKGLTGRDHGPLAGADAAAKAKAQEAWQVKGP